MGSVLVLVFFFFKQKTAYEMRISDWSSDVCSSDLRGDPAGAAVAGRDHDLLKQQHAGLVGRDTCRLPRFDDPLALVSVRRASEHVEQIGRASCRERVCQYV